MSFLLPLSLPASSLSLFLSQLLMFCPHLMLSKTAAFLEDLEPAKTHLVLMAATKRIKIAPQAAGPRRSRPPGHWKATLLSAL